MKLGATMVTQPLVVLPDPRAGGTPAAEHEHGTMSATLATLIADINRTLESLRDVRSQARTITDRAKATPSAERDAALRSLTSSVDSLESLIVQRSSGEPGPYDVLSSQPELMTDLNGLQSTIEGTSGPVTSGEREQFARLRARATQLRNASQRVLTSDVARVNALLNASGLTPITRKAPEAL
jgi:hypothetical protein